MDAIRNLICIYNNPIEVTIVLPIGSAVSIGHLQLPQIPPSASMDVKYFEKYSTSLYVVKEKLGSVDFKRKLGVTGNTAQNGVPGG
ncbi:hypothetical protein SeLEV6574_g02824 [Synchytrium endobioticum]|uniref:Uncharacterized protein n=1 Tax=Synchytrium endobioticum TaxID=286115 RepID=A0A507D7A3_9FUNG|nr:hypothetical protein SeLEV6574_g02824 [Synchytrium endobioticum]